MISYPVRIQDIHVRDKLRELIDLVNSNEFRIDANSSAITALNPPLTLAQIQKALSLGGSNPINVTGLQGTLANPQVSTIVGLFAARPPYGAVPIGTIFYATDQSTAYVASAAAWDTIEKRILFGGNYAILGAALTADRTYTLPDASDTVVLKVLAQVLAGKTFGDPSDLTKALAFSLSGATTGKTTTFVFGQTDNRSLAFPDDTGTLVYESTALTASNLILGAGTSKVAPLGALGTTVTVLHGNAAGSPSFGAVALTSDVSGVLPVANGGTAAAVLPARSASSPADPTGTTSTVGVMMGLAGALTPKVTGTVMITVTGSIQNGTSGDGAATQIRYGTGAAPANADAVSGTTAGVFKQLTAVGAGNPKRVPFANCFLVTGLTVNTAYWIDLALKAVTGGTASIFDLDIVAVEFNA